jgi:hypothetical protein
MAATGQNPNLCPCCGAEKLISIIILPIKTPNNVQKNKNIVQVTRPPPNNV